MVADSVAERHLNSTVSCFTFYTYFAMFFASLCRFVLWTENTVSLSTDYLCKYCCETGSNCKFKRCDNFQCRLLILWDFIETCSKHLHYYSFISTKFSWLKNYNNHSVLTWSFCPSENSGLLNRFSVEIRKACEHYIFILFFYNVWTKFTV